MNAVIAAIGRMFRWGGSTPSPVPGTPAPESGTPAQSRKRREHVPFDATEWGAIAEPRPKGIEDDGHSVSAASLPTQVAALDSALTAHFRWIDEWADAAEDVDDLTHDMIEGRYPGVKNTVLYFTEVPLFAEAALDGSTKFSDTNQPQRFLIGCLTLCPPWVDWMDTHCLSISLMQDGEKGVVPAFGGGKIEGATKPVFETMGFIPISQIKDEEFNEAYGDIFPDVVNDRADMALHMLKGVMAGYRSQYGRPMSIDGTNDRGQIVRENDPEVVARREAVRDQRHHG